ncbi:MAG TPA: hypothetical protein VEJ41_10210 [Candidatus Acidoferrales bacterium]|nr:hypothetical protein [Candidatus Acidoferrales bacterium]
MNKNTLFAVSLLERAAAASLRATFAELQHLQARRARLIAKTNRARRDLFAGGSARAFGCAVLMSHLAKSAVLSTENLAQQRALLARGAKLAQIRRRWATARVGLERRAARFSRTSRWPD